MVTVTGTLNDFGLAALAPFAPELVFTPSGPAVTLENVILASRHIVVPVTEGHGFFSVELASTDDLTVEGWYTLQIQWLNPDAGLPDIDFPDWRIYVPAEGGTLASMIKAPSNPALVWVGLTPPDNPTPGTWWLVDDPQNPGTGSGDLMEWS